MNIRSQIIWSTILMFGFYLPAFGLDANDPDLVGWWKFDDESGVTAEDSSGHGHHGVVDDANWCDGIIGGALEFDGKNTVSISPQVFSKIEKEITIAFWQYGKVDAPPAGGTILEASIGLDKRVIVCHVPYKENNKAHVYWDCGSAQGEVDQAFKLANPNTYEGKWNHWAFVKNTNSGKMKIYLNGTLWHSVDYKTRTIKGITEFLIGSITNIHNFYHGLLADLTYKKGSNCMSYLSEASLELARIL